MRIDRMLSITLMLLNRDRISARELAEKFEVSVRTIYRDVEAINMAGIPVISYSGNNGGFGIMENYKIDRRLLSMDDILSILTALRSVNIAFEDQSLDSTMEKIKSLVPKDKTGELDLRSEQIVIELLPWGYSKRYKDNLKEIQRSIIKSGLIEIKYRNNRGETTIRIIEPMTLLLKGQTWYLFAFCRLKNDFRLFRISRIVIAQPFDECFVRRKGSYRELIKWDSDPQKTTNLVLKFSPEMKLKVEEYFFYENITTMEDGYLIVCTSYPEDEWVYSFILSYGEYIEVLEPQHIRDIIQKKIKKMSDIYTTV